MQALEQYFHVYADAALCFVLSFFFGIGILLASRTQFIFPNLYQQVQTYFYGQAATLTDVHIIIYGLLVTVTGVLLLLFRKEFKIWIFDPQFAHVIGLPITLLNTLLLILVTVSIVIGIRSVGVVLMSAMLIAPAAAARQFARGLKSFFILAMLFGMFSALCGTYCANEVSWWLSNHYPDTRRVLPNGSYDCYIGDLLLCSRFIICSRKRATESNDSQVVI